MSGSTKVSLLTLMTLLARLYQAKQPILNSILNTILQWIDSLRFSNQINLQGDFIMGVTSLWKPLSWQTLLVISSCICENLFGKNLALSGRTSLGRPLSGRTSWGNTLSGRTSLGKNLIGGQRCCCCKHKWRRYPILEPRPKVLIFSFYIFGAI